MVAPAGIVTATRLPSTVSTAIVEVSSVKRLPVSMATKFYIKLPCETQEAAGNERPARK